jgi:hypothetical protein
MQRVRIGLTGLAFVFLVVMLAMALTREPAGEAPITPNLLDQQSRGDVPATPPAPARHEPTDPLSELGVAPGNAGSNDAAPASPPAAPAAPRR